jgi:hypothetical protein
MTTRLHTQACLQEAAEEQGWVDKFSSAFCNCSKDLKHDPACTHQALSLPQDCHQCVVIAKVRAEEQKK